MDNFESDGPPDGDWEDRGELAWNEFDWERYLREQDEAVHRYLGFYDCFRKQPDRIDRVAEQMGWETSDAAEDPASDGQAAEDAAEDSPEFAEEEDIYTLHKNPVFVATKAIYLSLKRPWELMAIDPDKVPARLGIPFLASLHRGEEQAVQAIHALDFGDYAMAISLFKRALAALNLSLSLLDEKSAAFSKPLAAYREDAVARLFDLREIWLRVISECRRELNRPVEEE
ncbi:MAG TPA: hypothetical protein VFE31_03255 [Opitutaceae bacterium]|jgi:hypothetical protein|nr:hypothetical protein [Opitutaceae bacterium]